MDKINFQNRPSTATPINASNLNLLQTNTENAINASIEIEEAIPSDYITISNSYTLASGSPKAYKIGNIVFYSFDITDGSINAGETQLGTCTNKILTNLQGIAKVMEAYPSTVSAAGSLTANPSGSFMLNTNLSGSRATGTIILLINE